MNISTTNRESRDPKRAIYASFSYPGHELIAKSLQEQRGWDPVYWIAAPKMEEIVNECFPDAVFHRNVDLRRGRPPKRSKEMPITPLDEDLIRSVSVSFIEVFDMMLRRDTTGFNFSYDQRLNFVLSILKHWNSVINWLKPDVFVSWVIPHGPAEYLLYLMCRYYGIPTLMINANACVERYFSVITSVEDQASVFMDLYESGEEIEPSRDMQDYFARMRSQGGIVPEYMHFTADYVQKQKSLAYRFRNLLRDLRFLQKNGVFKKSGSHFKSSKASMSSPHSEMSNLGHVFFQRKLRRNNTALFDIYESLTLEADFSANYVYFVPNYQPEATTSPGAGVFLNYFLILDILSSCIPSDWIIYYKEHPSTFRDIYHGSLARNSDYYQRLLDYPNVRLVSSSLNTFRLTDSAKVVATPVGTAAWEAVVRGVPAMSFGASWYMGCKSIFQVRSREDCSNAIQAVLSSYRPDPADIERYAAVIERVAYKDLLVRNFNERIASCDDVEGEMARIAEAIFVADST